MNFDTADKNLKNVILVGDRVLIKPSTTKDTTKGGLYLPPTVKEKEEIFTGYIIKVGPGYALPVIQETDEPWKKKAEEPQYVPLQAKQGDLALYVNKSGYEIQINSEKYCIVPHSAILMLYRDEELLS